MSDPSHAARALALAAHRLGAVAALARIAGPDGAAARAMPAAAALAARDELAAPRPARWASIHPSWIEAVLDGEPASIAAAVRGQGRSPLELYLARARLGALVPMPSSRGGAPGPRALVALEAPALTRALSILGRRQLAHALGDSAPRSIAVLAARLPWGKELMGDVAAIATLTGAATRLGRRASAQVRTTGLTWSDPLALPRAGARAIAPAVAAVPDLAAQLAQRLARPVGTVVAAELATFISPADGAGDAEIALAIARVTVGPR